MNVLLFDRDHNFVDAAYDQIETGDEQGDDPNVKDPHGLLEINKLVTSPGYAYIFVSNENPEQIDVYFDDMKVSHTKSPVIQMDDYYPFGLTFNSYSRENAVKNQYLYNNGAERQDELDLNVDATKFRMYDPAMGRWWQVDPLADEGTLISLTPYNYSGNAPIRYNDPDGDCPWCWGAVIGAAVDYGLQVTTNLAQGKELGDALTDVDVGSILVSAGAGAVSGGISSISKLKNASNLVKLAVLM